MYKIAVIDDYQNVAHRFADWKSLAQQAEVTFIHQQIKGEEELVSALQAFDILCVMRERTWFTRSLLERLPRLRMIASTGNWNAAIDMDATDALGITVCATGSSLTAAAEMTWTLLLACARRLPREIASFGRGGWQETVGMDLAGRTLGLVGLGYTGTAVARYGQAFGMKVLAWSQNLTPDVAADKGAEYVSKEELLRRSDFISVHVRLSERTRSLLAAPDFELMKNTAFLINTARGPIVDEAAMINALRSGRIAGAAADVFVPEPLPADYPLRRLENFIGTSHLGYVTEDSYRIYYGESLENIRAWIGGQPIRVVTSTNKEVQYVSKP
jgi:phosphoglycerate dehydrogenase-like enzyme